jgi:hypothetical protein
MALHLHNPVSQAHIEDLRDRLSAQLAQVPSDPYNRAWVPAVVDRLVEAVQAMDRGAASEEDTRLIFGTVRIPGFQFERWLAEMVEEGVYLETALQQAA